jgi:hypothetical protein
MKTKHDRGVPSDDELELLQSAAAGNPKLPKSRRRMDGQMIDVYVHDWQDVGVFHDEALLLPPPRDFALPPAKPTEVQAAATYRLGATLVPVTDAETQEDLTQFEFVCDDDVRKRTETVTLSVLAAEADSRPGMTRRQFRYVNSDVLLPNSSHEFRVRARNAVGWSDWSDISAPGRCLPNRPYRPGRPILTSVPDEPVMLRWSPARNNGLPLKSYEVSFTDLDAATAMHYSTVGHLDDVEDECLEWKIQSIVPGRTPTLRTVLYQATPKEKARGLALRRVYRVRADNTNGWSHYSELSDVIVLNPESASK